MFAPKPRLGRIIFEKYQFPVRIKGREDLSIELERSEGISDSAGHTATVYGRIIAVANDVPDIKVGDIVQVQPHAGAPVMTPDGEAWCIVADAVMTVQQHDPADEPKPKTNCDPSVN